MNNVFVYLEIEGTTVADVSLELLTKGRKLANSWAANWKLLPPETIWQALKNKYCLSALTSFMYSTLRACSHTLPFPILPSSSTCSKKNSRKSA